MELDPETIARLEIAIAAVRSGNERAEAALEEIRRREIVRTFRAELDALPLRGEA